MQNFKKMKFLSNTLKKKSTEKPQREEMWKTKYNINAN